MSVFESKMSKKIGLCLISSSLILNGCSRHVPPQDQQGVVSTNAGVVAPSGGGSSSTWWYFHSVGGHSGFAPGTTSHAGKSGGFTSSGKSGGFTSSPSVSARGGFGAAGHSFGGSGVS